MLPGGPTSGISGLQFTVTQEFTMPAVKSNRSKKKLKVRAKSKKQALKRRRVRARRAKGKY